MSKLNFFYFFIKKNNNIYLDIREVKNISNKLEKYI